jgi:hypothetical protein
MLRMRMRMFIKIAKSKRITTAAKIKSTFYCIDTVLPLSATAQLGRRSIIVVAPSVRRYVGASLCPYSVDFVKKTASPINSIFCGHVFMGHVGVWRKNKPIDIGMLYFQAVD